MFSSVVGVLLEKYLGKYIEVPSSEKVDVSLSKVRSRPAPTERVSKGVRLESVLTMARRVTRIWSSCGCEVMHCRSLICRST